MFSLKNILIFLAGVFFFHTIHHAMIPYYVDLPIHLKGFTLTPTFNLWAVVISAIITVALLWWASRIK
jgi:hypothetical protein